MIALILTWTLLVPGPYCVGRCTRGSTVCTQVAVVDAPEYTLPSGVYGTACYRLRPVSGQWSDQLCVSVSRPGSANQYSATVTVPK